MWHKHIFSIEIFLSTIDKWPNNFWNPSPVPLANLTNLRLLPQRLLVSPWPTGQNGRSSIFSFYGFLNEMKKYPFKSFRLLRKNGIDIITNIVRNPVFIWWNPVMIWNNPVLIWWNPVIIWKNPVFIWKI